MSQTPAELFVTLLARASRQAGRMVQGYSKADRDDITANAIAWCWENRDHYNPAVPVSIWFRGAMRHARDNWRRHEARHAQEVLADIPVSDSTMAHVENLDAARKILAAVPKDHREVVAMLAEGYTKKEIQKQGFTRVIVDSAIGRMAQLKRMVPDIQEVRRVVRTAKRQLHDESESNGGSRIDRDIAQLDAMPQKGKDCPPCWRCKWYDGYLPKGRLSTRMKITEPAVQAAVADVEARKITIASAVRAGKKAG